jgi:rhodanese-related sulfurtransferase
MVFRHFFSRPAIVEVTAEEAKAKQKAGALIVDVREPYEWQEGHIPSAVHIPLGSLSRRSRELDPSREVIAVCRSGHRSITAAQMLHQAGFSQVSSMAGGMVSWMRHRFSVSQA